MFFFFKFHLWNILFFFFSILGFLIILKFSRGTGNGVSSLALIKSRGKWWFVIRFIASRAFWCRNWCSGSSPWWKRCWLITVRAILRWRSQVRSGTFFKIKENKWITECALKKETVTIYRNRGEGYEIRYRTIFNILISKDRFISNHRIVWNKRMHARTHKRMKRKILIFREENREKNKPNCLELFLSSLEKVLLIPIGEVLRLAHDLANLWLVVNETGVEKRLFPLLKLVVLPARLKLAVIYSC